MWLLSTMMWLTYSRYTLKAKNVLPEVVRGR